MMIRQLCGVIHYNKSDFADGNICLVNASQSKVSMRKSRSGLFFLLRFRALVYSGYLFCQHFP